MSWVLVIQSCPPLCGLLDHRLLAHQAPLSMEFSRQEYWSGLPFPSPGVFWTPGLLHCRQILYCLSHQGSPPLQNTPLFMSYHCLKLSSVESLCMWSLLSTLLWPFTSRPFLDHVPPPQVPLSFFTRQATPEHRQCLPEPWPRTHCSVPGVACSFPSRLLILQAQRSSPSCSLLLFHHCIACIFLLLHLSHSFMVYGMYVSFVDFWNSWRQELNFIYFHILNVLHSASPAWRQMFSKASSW